MNKAVLSQKIDNPYIEFKDFEKRNFRLESIDEKPESIISDYLFQSKSKNTTLSFWISEVYGKKLALSELNIEKLKGSYAKVVEKRDFTFGGKKINRLLAFVGEKKSDGTVDNDVLSLYFNLSNGVNFQITTDKYNSEKKAINSALTLFVKNFKIKKDPSIIDVARYKDSIVSFDIIPDMNMGNSFTQTSFSFTSKAPQQGSVSTTQEYDKE